MSPEGVSARVPFQQEPSLTVTLYVTVPLAERSSTLHCQIPTLRSEHP